MNKSSAQVWFASIVSFGFFYCVFHMLTWGFPEFNKDALNSLLGVLTTIFTLQMNYFFGSSSASKLKDETISNIAMTAPSGNGSSQVSPIVIPDANKVTVQTTDGDVNVSPKTTITTEKDKST